MTSLVKTDNIAAGRRAADILATAIQRTYADAEGEVATIMDSMGVASFDERSKGFKQQLAAKYGALQIVADKVADREAATGFNIMAELINAHPELRGVCASSLFMAQGAGSALPGAADDRKRQGGPRNEGTAFSGGARTEKCH